jgi:hypothetical protein
VNGAKDPEVKRITEKEEDFRKPEAKKEPILMLAVQPKPSN